MNIKRQLAEFMNSNNSDKVDTVVGATVVIDGPLTSKKSIRIDGIIHGNVTTKGNVFTGPDSVINGMITARNITVCGIVNGDVKAKGRVILTAKARISGDLSMNHVVIDEGALINGNITMLKGDPTLESGDTEEE